MFFHADEILSTSADSSGVGADALADVRNEEGEGSTSMMRDEGRRVGLRWVGSWVMRVSSRPGRARGRARVEHAGLFPSPSSPRLIPISHQPKVHLWSSIPPGRSPFYRFPSTWSVRSLFGCGPGRRRRVSAGGELVVDDDPSFSPLVASRHPFSSPRSSMSKISRSTS